jgi:hypothetical protein
MSERVSRTAFDQMTPPEQTRFLTGGGILYDDEKPIDRGTLKGANGQEISRDEFDELSPDKQSEFLLMEDFEVR